MAEPISIQQIYTTIVEHFMHTGRAPHYTELASLVGMHPDTARVRQREAAAAAMGSWLAPNTDYIASWAPFSNLPTQYVVTIENDMKGYAQ